MTKAKPIKALTFLDSRDKRKTILFFKHQRPIYADSGHFVRPDIITKVLGRTLNAQ